MEGVIRTGDELIHGQMNMKTLGKFTYDFEIYSIRNKGNSALSLLPYDITW
jgi:hypothetical protein